jgi:hypothetical protein
VVARVIIPLAILAVLFQSATLRACAVEKQATGANCHGPSDDRDARHGEHSGEHGPCDRGPSCQCQVPRLIADKAKSATMPDLVPPPAVAIVAGQAPRAGDLVGTVAPAWPPDIPLAVQLPLLN